MLILWGKREREFLATFKGLPDQITAAVEGVESAARSARSARQTMDMAMSALTNVITSERQLPKVYHEGLVAYGVREALIKVLSAAEEMVLHLQARADAYGSPPAIDEDDDAKKRRGFRAQVYRDAAGDLASQLSYTAIRHSIEELDERLRR